MNITYNIACTKNVNLNKMNTWLVHFMEQESGDTFLYELVSSEIFPFRFFIFCSLFVRTLMLDLLVLWIVFCFVCLRHVSCVPKVATILGLSILDCSFGFLYRSFQTGFYLYSKSVKMYLCTVMLVKIHNVYFVKPS